MSDWTPPGYISVIALVRQHGLEKVHNDLFAGRLQAFKWDRTTGEPYEIEPTRWGMDGAERWLEKGLPPDYPGHPFMVIVRVEDEPPPTATDGAYVPEFMALMQEAIKHFRISEHCWPTNADLVPYFMAQTLSDGTPIRETTASYLATCCRPPEAMKGSNSK